LNRLIEKFKTHLIKHWFVLVCVLLHIIYFIVSVFMTLLVLRTQSDFYVYYRVGEIFVNNPNNLYNPAYYVNIWPFRYFPLSALMFVPYYFMGFNLGFIVFNLINLLLNILISILLYKIIILVRGTDHESHDKRVILYICLFLIGLPQIFNYVLGQINLYVTLFILLSLFIFIKYSDIKWQLIASIILGISIIIKPTTIFMIPFIILLGYDYEKKKFKLEFTKSFVRLLGVILPLLLNLILFFIYPNLLNGFLTANFTGSDTELPNHSFSITKIISNMFLYLGVPSDELSVLPIFLVVLLVIGGLSFIFYIFRKSNVNSMIVGYLFGILIMFLAYFDTWDHHILQIAPLLIISLFNLPRNSEITRKYVKPGFFFLNFFGLVFTGIFLFIAEIAPNLRPFYPFNFASTLFLILIFIGVSKHCLKKQNKGKS